MSGFAIIALFMSFSFLLIGLLALSAPEYDQD